jgi:2'-5' RNA ligase
MIHPEIWSDFVRRERSLGARRLDYPEWHKGRPRYSLWAIDADTEPVNERLRHHRTRLHEYLVQPDARQAHITVAVSGFLGPETLHDDDITPELVELQALRVHALSLPPFTLYVGGVNSFASAPFLEVADPQGALALIRQALTPDGREFRTTAYVPHVTIGIYSGEHAVAQLAPLLNTDRADALAIAVNAIGYYSYEAGHMGSPLRLERMILLSTTD